MIKTNQLDFCTYFMVRASRAHGFVRRADSVRPARARRSRDHFGIVSVRSKLPPLYVPVSPSPVSRETSRDLWPSIVLRRWSCSNYERHCERTHCVGKCTRRFNLHVQGKTTFMSPTFQTQARQKRRVFMTSDGGGKQQRFT